MFKLIAIIQIVFVEARKNYLEIHLLHRVIQTRMSLKALREELPSRLFIQPHRSFIVARKVIDKIVSGRIALLGREETIPFTKMINEGFM